MVNVVVKVKLNMKEDKVNACCPSCNHEWYCGKEEIKTMSCPNCGDKPLVKAHKKDISLEVGEGFTTVSNIVYYAELVNDKSVCFTDEHGFLTGIPLSSITPVKPITSGNAYNFNYNGIANTGLYYVHKGGRFITLEGYVLREYCTDIQLLTVDKSNE